MYIPYEPGEVGFALTEYRLMPALKDMTHTLLFAVVVLAVTGQHSLHNVPDRFRLPLDQQVQVVRH